jgi:hypothetical protein
MKVNPGITMKTIIAGLVLMEGASSVFASPSYEEYIARMCKDYADTADIYWRMAKMGRTAPGGNDKWLDPIRVDIEKRDVQQHQRLSGS